MKVAALTSGVNVPSARFRVRQHLPYLKRAGLDVTEYCPLLSQTARLPGPIGRIRSRYLPPVVAAQMMVNAALRVPGVIGSRCADVTWLERSFVPGLDDMAALVGRPLILDIDDAIWLYNPFGPALVRRLAARADMIFAGNNFIANWCDEFCPNVRIVPTAVDAERFRPRLAEGGEGAPFVIGWTGTSSNFRYLEIIEPALALFLETHREAQLLIVADKAPVLRSVPADQQIFVRWTADDEHIILHRMDVGIMPLDDSELSRGKCSFKALQYMASGIPVVASPVGMNAELFAQGEIGYAAASLDEWAGALEAYYADPGLRRRHGLAGRQVLEGGYSQAVIGEAIRRAMHELVR